MTGKWETSLPVLKRGERKTQGAADFGEPHLCAWQNHGAEPHKSSVEGCATQGHDPKQSAWLY